MSTSVKSISGIVVSIQDSGPGIPEEDLPRIFDRFYKSSDSMGMGLGLAIAKYIIQTQGGTIQAESKAGRARQFRSRCLKTLPDIRRVIKRRDSIPQIR